MCRHAHARRRSDNLVAHAPFAVCALARQVQWHGEHVHVAETRRQATHKVLRVRPVVAVHALADLRRNVAQQERFVHARLRRLGVRSRDHVPAVVARAEVRRVGRPERLGDTQVLGKHRLAAVDAFAALQRRRREVLRGPRGVAQAAVVRAHVCLVREHVI